MTRASEPPLRISGGASPAPGTDPPVDLIAGARVDSTSRPIWPGLVGAAALAATLRFTYLSHGLPELRGADEPVVVGRALLLLGGELPEDYDWPSGSMMLLAGAMRVGRVLWAGLADDPHAQYLFARCLFAVVGVALVVLCGLLGAAVAPPRHRQAVSWGTAGLVAVAYTAVRLSRTLHPEELQAMFVVAALVCSVQFDRSRERRWLVAGAGLAGGAAASKYLGGLVLLMPIASVLLDTSRPVRGRVRSVILACATAAGVFVVLAPGAMLHPGLFLDGVTGQFVHQDTGHLGYDSSSLAWSFHLTQSLPGSWGTLATALGIFGIGMALWRGTRVQRLLALYVVAAFVILGASNVRFPHYVLVFLPAMAPFVVLGALHLARILRAAPALVCVVLIASLAPTVLSDLRLVRAASTTDTRTRAAGILDQLDGPIVEESYTDVVGTRTNIGSIGNHPEVIDCNCFVVISSYMEERYRREPEHFASQVAVYDKVRARGDIVAVVRPAFDLSYRWDLLPQWGADEIPLTGPIGDVGPTIAILDLRDHR